ncbi:lipocalin family protein [Natronospira bacteriovora]|uniref:Outer membrane lipoprotein Blc n=1 Tax=Natronospira bacteriovora TaxID=3069753 RepID=A0ABU0W434_9GAMM|nr:lipocalin family protein [Natronospira sp. AB-CW4]MDQ2068663.1 lipocalin family protein [Natronospira sp. AB-CW4]
MNRKNQPSLLLGLAALALSACSSNPPMQTVDYVDIERFMGDWYVIAHIPTFIERDAHNALEQYELNEDGTIATTFTMRRGGFDERVREYNPTGFVRSENNAEWGMRFIWPFKGEFLIIYLDEDYQHTIIGRTKRDYVWLMAREPAMDEADYQRLVQFIADRGYDIGELRRVPHRWD